MFQQSTKPFATDVLALGEWQGWRVVGIGHRERHDATALVRSLHVVVSDEHLHEMAKMLLAADDEVIVALR